MNRRNISALSTLQVFSTGTPQVDGRLPARKAKRQSGIALIARNRLECLLDNTNQDGDVKHRECEGTRDDREAPAHLEHEEEHAT